MGELYLGEKSLVRPFLWTDIGLWLTAVSSYYIGERYITSAHSYAVRHAGLTSSSKSVSMLNTVGDYRSRGGVADPQCPDCSLRRARRGRTGTGSFCHETRAGGSGNSQ